MEAAADADPRGKRDPRDFALWKGHKADEPESASLGVAVGRRPAGLAHRVLGDGRRYLGAEFDIHGGGLDLRFPHHENELAQSTAAGDGFARYWVHNGLVNVDGQKMSKSLGNSVYAADLLGLASPLVVRYYLGGAHYRSTIDYHAGSLAEAEAALDRIEGSSSGSSAGSPAPGSRASAARSIPDAFAAAMDDDLACRRRSPCCTTPCAPATQRSTPKSCTTPPSRTARWSP